MRAYGEFPWQPFQGIYSLGIGLMWASWQVQTALRPKKAKRKCCKSNIDCWKWAKVGTTEWNRKDVSLSCSHISQLDKSGSCFTQHEQLSTLNRGNLTLNSLNAHFLWPSLWNMFLERAWHKKVAAASMAKSRQPVPQDGWEFHWQVSVHGWSWRVFELEDFYGQAAQIQVPREEKAAAQTAQPLPEVDSVSTPYKNFPLQAEEAGDTLIGWWCSKWLWPLKNLEGLAQVVR